MINQIQLAIISRYKSTENWNQDVNLCDFNVNVIKGSAK